MFYVENESTGEELSKGYNHLVDAIDEAKRLLEDDPEQGELQVVHYTVERIVRFGPDANWDTQVIVLRPGEKLQHPGFRCAPENIDESGGYDISDPKHPEFHSVHADIWDARAGK